MEVAMTLSPHPDVVCKAVSGGGILLHTRDEVYFGLDPVGLRIWELLQPEIRDLDELCKALAADYPDVSRDTLRTDVAELLESLRNSGLVVAGAA
jgi:hypothetical protein